MTEARDIALAAASGILLAGFGAWLILSAPATASLQSRMVRQPDGSVYWRIMLWWMRTVGALVILFGALVVLFGVVS